MSKKLLPLVPYDLTHVMVVWDSCKGKSDAIIHALRSACNNRKKPTMAVIQWITVQKDWFLRSLVIQDNIKWLQKMFARWSKAMRKLEASQGIMLL